MDRYELRWDNGESAFLCENQGDAYLIAMDMLKKKAVFTKAKLTNRNEGWTVTLN